MSTKANYFKLGVFVVSAAMVGIAALIAFGLGAFFQKKLNFETYLDESVQGLDVGSHVKLRGVTVGTVKRITFTSTKYPESQTTPSRQPYVLVEMDLSPEAFGPAGGTPLNELLEKEIARGLRIRLASQGITGLAYLEIDYLDPDKFRQPRITWKPEAYYLPSAPSTVTRFIQAFEDVFDKLYRVNIEALGTNLLEAAVTLRGKIKEFDAVGLSRNANEFLTEVKTTAEQLQGSLKSMRLDELSTNLVSTLDGVRRLVDSGSIDRAIAQLEKSLRRVDQLVAGSEGDLQASFENLRGLVDSLRDLADSLKQHPSQLIFSQPPKPVSEKP
jgi:ABC-type transporter Mla subunit MlaD